MVRALGVATEKALPCAIEDAVRVVKMTKENKVLIRMCDCS